MTAPGEQHEFAFDAYKLEQRARVIAFGVGAAVLGASVTLAKTTGNDSFVHWAALSLVPGDTVFTAMPLYLYVKDKFFKRHKPDDSGEDGWGDGPDDDPPDEPTGPEGLGWIQEIEDYANNQNLVGV